jgi:hypothetical protein
VKAIRNSNRLFNLYNDIALHAAWLQAVNNGFAGRA